VFKSIVVVTALQASPARQSASVPHAAEVEHAAAQVVPPVREQQNSPEAHPSLPPHATGARLPAGQPPATHDVPVAAPSPV